MTSRSPNKRRRASVRAAAGCALMMAALACGRAQAADLDDGYLRGPYEPAVEQQPVRWDGVYLGGQIGYSSMTVDYSHTFDPADAPNQSTSSTGYGGFLGYNWQVDPNLVLGLELGYTRPDSLYTSTSGSTGSASYKLVDYGTFRARAGYAFGQFLPFAELGVAVGRLDYTVSNPYASQDNAYALGFVGGLGIDVALLPNVFLRAEWEYAYFTPVKHTSSGVNTARVGLGIRF
jgi:outer membrane immunogenic protein